MVAFPNGRIMNVVLFYSRAVTLASTLRRISWTVCKQSPSTDERLGGTSLWLVPNFILIS